MLTRRQFLIGGIAAFGTASLTACASSATGTVPGRGEPRGRQVRPASRGPQPALGGGLVAGHGREVFR